MVCHVDGDVSELDDRVKYFTYPIQFDPGEALYDVGKVITLPPLPVRVKADDEILPLNESLLEELTVNVPLKVVFRITLNVPLTGVFPASDTERK